MEYDVFGNKIKKGSFDLGFGALPKKKSDRDTRRAFTKTQKNEILYQQDNKCAVCHKKLDPRDIEYDHKTPWASGGKTKTVNGRALCGSCHNKVTHKHKLKKAEAKREPKSNDVDLLGLPKVRQPKIKLF